MATIKEMAADAYLEGNYGFDSGDWQEAYLLGANAVLEKIECHLNRISVDNHTDDDLEDLYDILYEMIKNLKGE